MADLKKPSEYFKKEQAFIDNAVENLSNDTKSSDDFQLSSFSDAYDSFRNNLGKIDSFSESLNEYNSNVDRVNNLSEKIDEIQTEIKNFLSKEDLDRALISQLLVVEQSIRDIQGKVKGINENNLKDIRSDVAHLTESVNEFLEVEVPKYKKISDSVEKRFTTRYEELEENVNQSLDSIETFVGTKYQELTETLQGINEDSLKSIIQDFKNLDKTVLKLQEKEIPKYKKLIVDTELKTESKLKEFDQSLNETLENLNVIVDEKIQTLDKGFEKLKEEEIPKYKEFIVNSELKTESKLKKFDQSLNETLENLDVAVNNKIENIDDSINIKILNLDTNINNKIEDIDSVITGKINNLDKSFEKLKEEEIPKYKKFIVDTELKTENKIEEFNAVFEETVNSLLEKINLVDGDKANLIKIVNDKIQEVISLRDLVLDDLEQSETSKKDFIKKINDLEVEVIRNESHLKVQNKNLEQIQEDVRSAIQKLNLEELEEKNYELGKKVKYLEEVFEKFNEKEILTESIVAELPSTNNENPLTPLDQNFVTLDQLQNHYRLFINRIQQQLSTIGGGGETRLKYLDDIVGIATNASAYDGKFLTYDDTLKKFKFDIVPEQEIDISEQNVIYVAKDGNDANAGTLSRPKLTIKDAVETLVSVGVTDRVVRVAPGTYIENNPIVLPDEISVVGQSLRETTVIPQNDDKDLFHIGNANYVAEMSFRGSLPGKAIFAFDPVNQRYISQSPYIQNCTNFIPDSIGMRIDGKDSIGPLKSMVLDSYTQYNQGGIGVSITNEAYAQLVSLFTICDDIAVYCGSGGACDLTNSNSSFGNYGLVADGVSGKKYSGIATVASSANSDTFAVDLSVPTLNVVDADYNNETGRIKVVTNQPHKFNVGMAVTLAGLGFTCDFEPGIREYPSGANGYVFNVETVAPGRYLDAANLIQANKAEIQDKSLASIALNYPKNFIFPGDPADNFRYRFYDSYRLIQKNKQEIVDKSLAAVAIAHSDFYFPGDTQTTIRSRYYDSYRLIQRNRSVIVDSAWTELSTAYPDFTYSETKCRRDIGFFIDAISADVFTGGNNYSREFVLQYFDGNVNIGIAASEVAPSVYAFQQARNFMKSAITNTLVGAAYSDLTITIDSATGSNTDPASCANVRDNIDTLSGIVTTSIGAGNTSSLPLTPNLGYFNLSVGIGTTVSPGGVKCARDLGFLVDAVSTDVFTGGNKYVREFSRQYFDNAGNPIANGIVDVPDEIDESITAFNALREYAKKAITNQLNYKEVGISSGPAAYDGPGGNIPVLPSGNPDSCTDVQNNIDTLVGIVTGVIGSGSLSSINNADNLGTFTDVGSVCRRDIGYIVDAVTEDLIGYTNSNIIDATKKYFTYSGVLDVSIENEIPQTITAFESARDYMKLALNNQLNSKDLTILAGVSSIGQGGPIIPVLPSGNPDSCTDVQDNIDNLVGIITTNLGNRNLNSIPKNVSLASTIFTVDVGIATQPHYYNSGGEVKTNVIRPFDGQSIYFNELFYTVKRLIVVDGGSGYTTLPTITIQEPDTPWGIKAQAVPVIENGVLVGAEMISNGRGYRIAPRVTISSGINTAVVTAEIVPEYYTIQKSTEITNGVSIITTNEVVPFDVGIGTEVKFFKQSRVLATGHSFEFIGAGTDIANALPFNGGTPPNPDNETDARNGGLVVYSSTNQAGNFKIGDGVIINQNTGNISGQSYSKSLISTMTPYILSLGGF